MAQGSPPPPSPSTPDDFALLDSIAAGDAAALEQLYNRHSAVVFALCARILGDKVEAEDVLVNVFNQVWLRAGQFDSARGAPVTYLLTIARSRALDCRRSRRRMREASAAQATPDSVTSSVAFSAPSDGPVARLVASEEAHQVRAALAQLGPDQRRAIELSFFDGLSHAQIAEQLAKPLGTIKTMIRQGLIQIRQSVRTLDQGSAEQS